ncbi:DUF4139 domain-containing protein [Amycolatopsis sp. H20-H5]|uniref:DUF4139 domain-containing protein n=1 Tax=Amycolatopsis sp. H20-H5 TaxID=3046309 RepID=UPI002DB87895|nr:DUF4139 domain-containing protein [Amycolatopsis sp. H20-H5]MEC3973973.1 DUF4139 domain-containing protein [Amycolatopsis sp. H20-H5]
MPTSVEAPIVAVTVYPQHARITRRGSARLDTGSRFTLDGLPAGLAADSVRVTGTGPATILGVDVTTKRHANPADPALRALTDRRRADQAALDEVTDAETAETTKVELLTSLAQRSGGSFAKALAAGTAEPGRVAEVTDALSAQLATALKSRRELTDRRAGLAEDLAALDREIANRQGVSEQDSTTVTVELEAEPDAAADAGLELELSYVVTEAHWESGYDVRLRDEQVQVTWHGLVTQHTGEDWPECELALSTARPATTVDIPELGPWYLDRVRPVPEHAVLSVNRGYGGAAPAAAQQQEAAPALRKLAFRPAEVEQGAAAATYRPGHPVAVPSGAQGHRTTLAQFDWTAKLGYVTAPVLAEEAHLRATVVNGSEHTLRPGRAAVFHGSEFVGTTRLSAWAPGEEVELALGVDDRIRVERELVRRTAGKAALSGTKRREAEYRTTVTNHGPREAAVTVLDQFPVSRDDAVVVRDVRATPDPAETTELGEFTWRIAVAPGQAAVVTLAFRVDVAKGVELAGWRE